MTSIRSEPQPAMRGVFHAAAAVMLPGITASLLAMGAFWGVLPVALVCEFQLVMSALMHLNPTAWPTAWYSRVRRLDHLAIFLCGFTLAACYGVVDRAVMAIFLINFVVKLFGSSYWTKWNSMGVSVQYGYMTWLIITQGDDLGRFAIILPYLVVVFGTYAAEWPLRGHPVFGYHEIMHLSTLVIMALTIMKASINPQVDQLMIDAATQY